MTAAVYIDPDDVADQAEVLELGRDPSISAAEVQGAFDWGDGREHGGEMIKDTLLICRRHPRNATETW